MIMDIKTHDGLVLKGNLLLPDGNGTISKLIIYIGGAGPSTYNNGFPANLCTDKGIAHFSYNKRGVDIKDESPFFTVNYDEYKTYLPSNSVEDIRSIIRTLKEIDRLADCKVLLNGWFDGGSAMLEECFSAIDRKDDDWLMERMMLTPGWFTESYNLLSNNDMLPTLNLPIYIFNGDMDGFCDIQGVYKIKEVFAGLGKTNLTVNVFEHHGHGLDLVDSSSDEISEGMRALIDAFNNFKVA